MMTTKKVINPGVGMPAALHLNEFGSQLWSAFGKPAYQVGSSLYGKQWRDVDIRLILDDDEYERMGLGDPYHTHINAKWVALVMAFSALGKQMTGLPIDFQIQQQSYANKKFDGPRNAIGFIESRLQSKREKAYDELIYAVGNKYDDETRHQTALRYIQQAEADDSNNTVELLKANVEVVK
jgi:hypothetical protein